MKLKRVVVMAQCCSKVNLVSCPDMKGSMVSLHTKRYKLGPLKKTSEKSGALVTSFCNLTAEKNA